MFWIGLIVGAMVGGSLGTLVFAIMKASDDPRDL